MRRKFVLDLSFFLLLPLVTFAPVTSFLVTSTVSAKAKAKAKAKATRVDCRFSTSLPPSLSRLRTSTQESPSVPSLQLQNSRPYLFTILTALAIAISYADRTNLSTSIIPMTDQYGWDASTSGLVLSSFWLGYGSSQVIGGKVADRYRKVELRICIVHILRSHLISSLLFSSLLFSSLIAANGYWSSQ